MLRNGVKLWGAGGILVALTMLAVGCGGGNDNGGDAPAPRPAASSKKKDEVVEDIGDEPINLDDIPF